VAKTRHDMHDRLYYMIEKSNRALVDLIASGASNFFAKGVKPCTNKDKFSTRKKITDRMY
jgi:hypothetical protein